MLLFSPPLKLVREEKLEQRIFAKDLYNTSFYPGDPVAKGENLKKNSLRRGGLAALGGRANGGSWLPFVKIAP